jgi:hypothetical protein
MNSPAPNIPGAVSAMSPFTEYIMNELELEATSEDDIRAGDETLDAIFAEDHAHDVGGGAASAGRTPATPQEGNELELEATSVDDIRAGDETLDAIFAEDHALGVGGGAASLAGRMPATPQEGGDLATARAMAALSFVDIDQKPPADEGKHAPLKKTPCQSIIGCDDTGIFLKKAPIVTKMERKKMLYKNSASLPKVSLIVAFSIHALPPSKPLPELRKSLSNSPSRANIIP